MADDAADGGRGFVYAATGAAYITLARRAARSLRQVMPQAQIDFYTDVPLQDPVFDAVHLLNHASRRPKMEALLRSRFARTIYLDADTIPLAPLGELFDVLDQFEIALVAEAQRCDTRNLIQDPEMPVPVPFAPLNGGMLVVRKSDRTDDFLRAWQARVHDGTQKYDQLSLRALLYRSDLRLLVLPTEYNLMWLSSLIRTGPAYPAPRMLHLPRLHRLESGDPLTPIDVSETLSEEEVRLIRAKLDNDPSLNAHLDVAFSPLDLPLRKPEPRWRRVVKNWLRGTI